MVKSMTGFGKAEALAGERKILVEVRSLNSKQMDLSSFRIPHRYKARELDLRSAVAQALVRGKVDVHVALEQEAAPPGNVINREVFAAYYRQLHSLGQELSIPMDREPIVQAILRLPDVFSPPADEVLESEWEGLEQALGLALARLIEFREQEGEAMRLDLMERIRTITGLLRQIEPLEPERIAAVTRRLREAIDGAGQGIPFDRSRLEQELLYYLERLDLNEEKVRLANHCQFFLETLGLPEPAGRKLGFIAQEMGREINTLGSKANHDGIQRIIVRMKDELEKIKEQLLNVL